MIVIIVIAFLISSHFTVIFLKINRNKKVLRMSQKLNGHKRTHTPEGVCMCVCWIHSYIRLQVVVVVVPSEKNWNLYLLNIFIIFFCCFETPPTTSFCTSCPRSSFAATLFLTSTATKTTMTAMLTTKMTKKLNNKSAGNNKIYMDGDNNSSNDINVDTKLIKMYFQWLRPTDQPTIAICYCCWIFVLYEQLVFEFTITITAIISSHLQINLEKKNNGTGGGGSPI